MRRSEVALDVVVRAMGNGMRWADGSSRSIGAPRTGAAIASILRVIASTSSKTAKGVAVSRRRANFPAAVAEIRERLGDLPMLLAGMIGSNRGWAEAPYVPCPAGIDDLARKIVWAGERAAIVPGVSYVGQGRADVMRGEEVQLLGGIAAGLVVRMVRVPSGHAQQVGGAAQAAGSIASAPS